MSDTRYMKRRGGRWWFQIAVPLELQQRYGRKNIYRPLGTADTRKAQNLRWEHVAAWKAAFKTAKAGEGLDRDEIERQAQAEYRRLAAGMYVSPSDHDIELAEQTGGDPVAMVLSESISDAVHDLADGNWLRVWKQLVEVCARAGNPLPDLPAATGDEIAPPVLPDLDQTQTELATALMRAHVAALEDALARRRGEPSPPVGTFNVARTSVDRVAPRRGKSMPVSQAAREYVGDKMRDPVDKWTAQTKKQNEAVYRLFLDHVGDCPIDSVTRQDATGFRSTVARLKPTWARSATAKGLPLADLIEKFAAANGEPGLSGKTLDRYVSALTGLFRWAREGGLYDSENPFAGMLKKKKQEKAQQRERTRYLAFEPDELAKLFNAPLLASTPYTDRVTPRRHDAKTALMWLPLVALYTGMRSEEIAQFRLADVKTGEIKLTDGKRKTHAKVTYFDIAENAEGQNLKTVAAIRKVPVHPMLIRCGFLEYAAHVKKQGHDLLFPGLKPGGPDGKRNWYFTRAFMAFRRGVGVVRIDHRTKNDRLGFHSFRATVATALEGAHVPESEAVQVLGHERMSMSYGHYSGGLDLARLQRVVEAISYDDLDLSHLYTPVTGKVTVRKRAR